MSNMFLGCKRLKDLNISNFTINKSTLIYYMFYVCSDELINNVKKQIKNFPIEAISHAKLPDLKNIINKEEEEKK